MDDEMAVLIVTPELAQKVITNKEVFYWARMPGKSYKKITDAVEKIQEAGLPKKPKKWLREKDFIKVQTGDIAYYFSFKSKDYEICIEPCLNGFDIAVYDNDKSLLEPKVCTNVANRERLAFWEDNSWIRARNTAQMFYNHYEYR